MMKHSRSMAIACAVSSVMVMAMALWALPAKTRTKSPSSGAWTQVTYYVEGLHCQGCVDALQSTFKKTAGVKSTRLSVEEKIARVTYDENKASVQRVARSINETPSPMPNSSFRGSLVLRVEKVKSEKDQKAVAKALGKVRGVYDVGVHDDKELFLVAFDKEGNAEISQLTNAVKAAGYKATAWAPKTAVGSGSNKGHSGHGSRGGGCGGNHGGQGGGGCCGGGGGGTKTRGPQTAPDNHHYSA